MIVSTSRFVALVAAAIGLASCSSMDIGGGSSPATGSAGQSGDARGAATQLVQCGAPVGTIALVESQIPSLAQANLSSPVPLIRLMAAQSRCFDVVERGAGFDRMMQERQLAKSGQLQPGANIGSAQIVAADYLITPNVVFAERNAGSVGGAVGAALGSFAPYGGSALGSLAGSVHFSEAQAVMLITDTRSGVQVAVAEGRARASDLSGGLGLASVPGFGSVSGYSNTNEGKVVAGAFLDAFNKLVDQVRALARR